MSSIVAKAKAKREEKKMASDQEKQNNQDEKDEIEREKQTASFRAHWQWSLCQFDDRMPEEARALGVPHEEFKALMNVSTATCSKRMRKSGKTQVLHKMLRNRLRKKLRKTL